MREQLRTYLAGKKNQAAQRLVGNLERSIIPDGVNADPHTPGWANTVLTENLLHMKERVVAMRNRRITRTDEYRFAITTGNTEAILLLGRDSQRAEVPEAARISHARLFEDLRVAARIRVADTQARLNNVEALLQSAKPNAETIPTASGRRVNKRRVEERRNELRSRLLAAEAVKQASQPSTDYKILSSLQSAQSEVELVSSGIRDIIVSRLTRARSFFGRPTEKEVSAYLSQTTDEDRTWKDAVMDFVGDLYEGIVSDSGSRDGSRERLRLRIVGVWLGKKGRQQADTRAEEITPVRVDPRFRQSTRQSLRRTG